MWEECERSMGDDAEVVKETTSFLVSLCRWPLVSLSFLRIFWAFLLLFLQFHLSLATLTLGNRLMLPDVPNVQRTICIGCALLEGMKPQKSSRNDKCLNLFLLTPSPNLTVWLRLQGRTKTWDNTEPVGVELLFPANDAEEVKDLWHLSTVKLSREFPAEGNCCAVKYTSCMLNLHTSRWKKKRKKKIKKKRYKGRKDCREQLTEAGGYWKEHETMKGVHAHVFCNAHCNCKISNWPLLNMTNGLTT